MTYKMVQMCVRGFTLTMMLLGLYFNWECYDLTTTLHFILSGVYGSFAIVTLGFLAEAGLYLRSDKFIEVSFLIGGIALNVLCSLLSFMEYYSTNIHKSESINKGFVSLLGVLVYLLDLVLLNCA